VPNELAAAEAKKEEREIFFYSPDTWALSVIGMVRNSELYQTLY
jgi:hypothetical protein